MTFVPYIIMGDRLPKLRRGHLFKIATKFYMITATRRWRKQWTDAGAYVEPGQEWSVKNANLPAGLTADDYAALTGDVNLGRITHLQYLSLSTALAVTLRWKDQPLLTKTNLDTLVANIANLAAPLELDKWTYDTTIHIKLIKAAGIQTFTMEGVEYDVQPGEAGSTYCELFADGSYQFVGY